MKPLILIWIGLSSFALSTRAQQARTTPPAHAVGSDIRREEAEARRSAKQIHDVEQTGDKNAITYDRSPNGEYVFTCHNNTFSNYIVELYFPTLDNLRSDVPVPYRMDVAPGTRRMLSLSIVTRGSPVRFTHRFRYFKGYLSDKSVDTAYTYLLPVPPGRETHIYELSYLPGEYGGQPEPKGWYALSFHVHSGDTVYAARRGRVTEVRDNAGLPDSGYTFSRSDNYVEISHSDCTFGKYTAFRDSSIFVSPGDFVEAGQPIGIAGGDKYAGGPQVRMSVYYHLEQEIQIPGEEEKKTVYWAYVPLHFWTKDQGSIHLTHRSKYVCEHPSGLITKEMSRKEVKKWMESH
ncbi:MAG TPA: M23 family metallopeptidase [Puia sp.]